MQLGLYVAVNDMERAVAFYRAVFGVEPIQQTDRYSAFSIGGVPFGLFDGGSYAHPLAVGNNCVPNVQVDDIDAEYARIRPLASKITDGIQQAGPFRLFMFAAQDIRTGGRQSDSDYQYTLSSTDLGLLQKWAPIVGKRMETVEGITDVSSDRDPGGLQLSLVIDRKTASSLGVRVQDIDNALNNAFAQRQISIIYTQRNQYMVVLEIDPKFQADPSNLERIFVAALTSATFAVVSGGVASLVVLALVAWKIPELGRYRIDR